MYEYSCLHFKVLLNPDDIRGPDVKILLTLDSERYTSNFDIGGRLGQCCI